MAGGERRKSALDWEDTEPPQCEYHGHLCAFESQSGAGGVGTPGVKNAGGRSASTGSGCHKESKETVTHSTRNPITHNIESTISESGCEHFLVMVSR